MTDARARPGFEDVSEEVIAEAMRAHPLAWIACEGEPFLAAAPVIVGPSGALEGHMPRRWPLARRFGEGCEATFLFLGPNGYMSPSWLSDADWAPTWNFVSVQVRARVELREDEDFLLAHLGRLCALTEAGRSDWGAGWRPDRLGERLRPLAARIVAFTAAPLARQVRFKLGQDERDDVLAELLQGVAREPGGRPLHDWMARLNAWREAT